jgi:tRNA(Arg) A34 adenosine deaminase TadA
MADIQVSGAIDHMSDEISDEILLRRAFGVAREAAASGGFPFGAVLVGPDGGVLLERGNEVGREGGDATAHAERLLVSSASAAYGREFLAGCALYASAEPCAMCAGAVYWSGIGRVVFGQSVESLAITCPDDRVAARLDIPCRTVFATGLSPVDVTGPLLEDEAAALQALRPQGAFA